MHSKINIIIIDYDNIFNFNIKKEKKIDAKKNSIS